MELVSQAAERLVISEEGLSSMELVSLSVT
jgi:hypothetical protein